MILSHEKVLILAPHTDDGELGCGGTIAKFIEEKAQVYYAAFSVCEDSVQIEMPKNTLEMELRQAIAVLGISPSHLIIHRYPVRHLPQNRQNVLQNLIDIRESINPDLVFLPSVSDIHQDHHTIYQEGLRAFRYTNMLGYELPWNNLSFNTISFAYLEERHILKKIEALKKYISQKDRAYMNEEFVRSLARARGVQIGVHYAEAFEVIRLIIK